MKIVALIICLVLAGCAKPNVAPTEERRSWVASESSIVNYGQDQTLQLYLRENWVERSNPVVPMPEPTLSQGDWIALQHTPHPLLEKHQVRDLSGRYQIHGNGQIYLPLIPPVHAIGITLQQLTTRIYAAYQNEDIFREPEQFIQMYVWQWAPITVWISGAVFQPGPHQINVLAAKERQLQIQQVSGAPLTGRQLDVALRAAGGIRPDADIQAIVIKRKDKIHSLDLSGYFTGQPLTPFYLAEGDEIWVTSRGVGQAQLAKPSPITPPGMRIFVSNLAVPVAGNANGAINKHATELPYGVRLHAAVVSGNCVGGTQSTNSRRFVVLITKDWQHNQPITIERRVQDLLSQPDDLSINPYVMPNDSLVCFDSQLSNVRDIARTITDLVLPYSLLR